MSKEALASLIFYDGQFEFQRYENETTTTKFLSPADVAAAFRYTPIDSGWISSEIIRMGQVKAQNFAVAWFSPKSYKCTFLSRRNIPREETIPLPGLLFAGKSTNYAIWATSKHFSPTKSILYRVPLPNVHINAGICWGKNKPPECTAKSLREAFALFMHSPFNNDLVTDKSRKYPRDIYARLSELENKKSYAIKDLVPVGKLQHVIDSWLGIKG
jgi:hypothetical protein